MANQADPLSKLIGFLDTGAGRLGWLQRQASGTGAKGKSAQSARNSADQNSLAAALRNRGGAQAPEKPSSRKRPTRGRSRHSKVEVEQSSATSSTSATSATSATSSTSATSDRRPSWAPNASALVEQAREMLDRGIEAAGTWRAKYEVSKSRKATLERLHPKLLDRLRTWFDKQKGFQGSPPRLTTRLFHVERGSSSLIQVALVWRGIEVLLLLGPSERDLDFAVFDARTECNGIADVGDHIRWAAQQCREEPLEAFLDLLMPADDDDVDYASSEEHSFADNEGPPIVQFIRNRPPTHRFQKASTDIKWAWDFPLSRQERVEFLLANTLAEEKTDEDHYQAELQEEAEPRRRSRRWSRASGQSKCSAAERGFDDLS